MATAIRWFGEFMLSWALVSAFLVVSLFGLVVVFAIMPDATRDQYGFHVMIPWLFFTILIGNSIWHRNE